MPSILDKLCWGRAIGVYFSGTHISVTDVGSTVKGLAMLNQQSFEIADKEPVQFLTETLQEYIKNHGGKNAPLCLGIKPEQMFFITLGAECEQQEKLRDKLLDSAGFHNVEERHQIAIDYFRINKVKSSMGQLWGIGVCKKQIAEGLYAAFSQAGFSNITLRPTPWAMSSFAIKLPKKHRHWKVIIKVLLNETGGLAILVIEKHPMCWKRFSFPEAGSIEKIESAIKGILIQSTVTLGRPVIDGIVLEGPKAEEIGQKLYDAVGLDVATADGPGFTDSQCSYSLAMSAKTQEDIQFDIFHELRSKPSIKQIFPWKIAAMIVFAAVCMGVMMWEKASGLSESYNNIKNQNSAYKWASGKYTGEIAAERKNLLAETETIVKFASSRIIWSDYLRDLPTRLPPNVGISSLMGSCELSEDKKDEGRKPKKSLSLRGSTVFDKGKAAPEEIEAFMGSLKKVDLLKRDFSQIQLTDIRWRREGNSEAAIFTVLAVPKKAEKSDGGAGEAGGTGGTSGTGAKGGAGKAKG